MSIYDTLNPMQKEAVLHTEGPLLILAGAGSGKTRVLTHRVAYLIEEKQVNPWNILAITFTNKAAGEMRERVDQLVGFGAESIWVSTFHSTCVRILRRHIEYLGYTTNFSIYDSDDQKTLMKDVCKLLQIDTTNILFICGGAFAGLEHIINARVGKKNLGFGADIRRKEEVDNEAVFAKVLPEDIMKFGIIPEFAGRMPVVVTLNPLDEAALVQILTEPRNALVKQYQRFLEMDCVDLEFEPGALTAIAEEALKRNAGARGLRSIIESTMRNVMYDVPSRDDVTKCIVTEATIRQHCEPQMLTK